MFSFTLSLSLCSCPGLTVAKEDDFDLFTNLFHINAAENNLKLEVYWCFFFLSEYFNKLIERYLSILNSLSVDFIPKHYTYNGILVAYWLIFHDVLMLLLG